MGLQNGSPCLHLGFPCIVTRAVWKRLQHSTRVGTDAQVPHRTVLLCIAQQCPLPLSPSSVCLLSLSQPVSGPSLHICLAKCSNSPLTLFLWSGPWHSVAEVPGHYLVCCLSLNAPTPLHCPAPCSVRKAGLASTVARHPQAHHPKPLPLPGSLLPLRALLPLKPAAGASRAVSGSGRPWPRCLGSARMFMSTTCPRSSPFSTSRCVGHWTFNPQIPISSSLQVLCAPYLRS